MDQFVRQVAYVSGNQSRKNSSEGFPAVTVKPLSNNSGPKSSLTINSQSTGGRDNCPPQLPQTSCSTSGTSKLRINQQHSDMNPGPKRRLTSTKAGDSQHFKNNAAAVLDNVVRGSAINTSGPPLTTNAIIQGSQMLKANMDYEYDLPDMKYGKSEFDHSNKLAKAKGLMKNNEVMGVGESKHSLIFNSPDVQKKEQNKAYVSGSSLRKKLPEFSPLLDIGNCQLITTVTKEDVQVEQRVQDLTVATERRAHSLAQTTALGAAQILPHAVHTLNSQVTGDQYFATENSQIFEKGLVTLQPQSSFSGDQNCYETNGGQQLNSKGNQQPGNSRTHSNSHLNSNINSANIDMVPSNSATMSVAAKAGEMQIFSSEVIEKHLKQKPQFNFACPASPQHQFAESRPMKSRGGIPTGKNTAQLLPKLSNKQADPNITEFMTRLVSPPSRGPQNQSQFKTTFRTQGSVNGEYNNGGDLSLGSTMQNSQPRTQEEFQKQSDICTDDFKQQSLVQKKASQFKQYVSDATKRTHQPVATQQQQQLKTGSTVVPKYLDRKSHQSELMKNNNFNPGRSGIHSRRNSDKRMKIISTSQNLAAQNDYLSQDPLQYNYPIPSQHQPPAHHEVAHGAHKFFSPEARYSVTNQENTVPVLKKIDYVQSGDKVRCISPNRKQQQKGQQVVSDKKGGYIQQGIVREAAGGEINGGQEDPHYYNSIQNQHLTLGGPLTRQPPPRLTTKNRSPLVNKQNDQVQQQPVGNPVAQVGKEMATHFYPPNFRMQGHHFNNLANKRNRMPDEQLNTQPLQKTAQIQESGGISMALTGQRILGREQETQQVVQKQQRQRVSLESAQQQNYGVTSPREGQGQEEGIMGQRMLRINNIASPPARGPDPVPQTLQINPPEQQVLQVAPQQSQTTGTAKNQQPQYHFIYDYLFVSVTKQQFEREYAPKLALRENTNARNLFNEAISPRVHSPDVAMTYMKAGSPRTLEKRGQAIQALLSAAERRQQNRQQNKQNFNSPTSTPQLNLVLTAGSPRAQHDELMNREDLVTTPRELNIQEDVLADKDLESEEEEKRPQYTTNEKLAAVLLETQFDGLKVLHSQKVLSFMRQFEKSQQSDETPKSQSGLNLPSDVDEEKMLNMFVNDVTAKLHEQNKRFKVTIKKKYVNEILLQSKGAQNLAQYVVLIVCNNINQLVGKNNEELKQRITKKRDKSKDAGENSYEEESDEGVSNSKVRAGDQYLKSLSMRKQVRGRRDLSNNHDGKQTPQMNSVTVNSSQTRRVQGGGYESESEIMAAKSSLNSATTSSTLPQFLGSLLQAKDRERNGGKQSTPKKGSNPQQQSANAQIPGSRSQFNPKLVNRSGAYNSASGAANRTEGGVSSASGQPRQQVGQSRDFQATAGQESATELQDQTGPAVQRELTQSEIKALIEQRAQKYKEYAPTKIKIAINMNEHFHHFAHPINILTRDYNEFVRLVFKNMTRQDRVPKVSDVQYALKLARRLGLHINKNHLAMQFLKVRENSNAVKEKLIQFMCRVMQRENDFSENFCGEELFKKTGNKETAAYSKQLRKLKDPRTPYKFYVGKGNNATMVRTLLKARFWWQLHDKEDIDKVNFMWTQLRKNSVMTSFKCKLNKRKKGLDSAQQSPPSKLKGSSSLRVSGSTQRRQVKSAHPGSHKSIEDDQTEETQDESGAVSRMTNQEQVYVPPLNQANGYPVKIYNKLEDNYHLSNKKALFINMKTYYEAIGEDPFIALPMTFHVKSGLHDPEFVKFKKYYQEAAANNKKDHNIWIIKPGECTNRGYGIQVAQDFSEIVELVESSTRNSRRTCIVQKYIHNPLLISKRKFDIRTFAMLTSINGNLKGYEYEEGYLRTSSAEYTIKNLNNRMVHLCNDAIQKKSEDYGKFEPGNKMGYEEFQRYLDKNHSSLNVCFERDIQPQIRKLTADCFRSVWGKIDPYKRLNTFECYGLDFMMDEDFKVYLIEVNTNPCLELSSPLLARLIPHMLDNALRLVVDPLFPPPENFSQRKQVVNELCPEQKFELVFDERVDGPQLAGALHEKENVIVEIDEEELSDADDAENEENDKNNRVCEEDLLAGSIE